MTAAYDAVISMSNYQLLTTDRWSLIADHDQQSN